MEGIPVLDFIKENKAWCAVLAACIVLLAVYVGWYFTHPRLTFVTNCAEEVAGQIVPRGRKTLPPLDGDIPNEGYTLEGWYTEPEFVNRYKRGVQFRFAYGVVLDRGYQSPGRYRPRQSNRLCSRWLPPSWGCAPSHLPPVGRYKGKPSAKTIPGVFSEK